MFLTFMPSITIHPRFEVLASSCSQAIGLAHIEYDPRSALVAEDVLCIAPYLPPGWEHVVEQSRHAAPSQKLLLAFLEGTYSQHPRLQKL